MVHSVSLFLSLLCISQMSELRHREIGRASSGSPTNEGVSPGSRRVQEEVSTEGGASFVAAGVSDAIALQEDGDRHSRDERQSEALLWRFTSIVATLCGQCWEVIEFVTAAFGRIVLQSHEFMTRLLYPPSFLLAFESRYGDRHPPFFQGSLRDSFREFPRMDTLQAFLEARSSQKPLAVYIDEGGPLSEAVCQGALRSSLLIELFQSHNFLFVGLFSSCSEGAWLQQLLRVQQLPCLLLFVPSPLLPRTPPRDPRVKWQVLAQRWIHSALQGLWGEAEAVSQALSAVDHLGELQKECERRQQEAAENQM
ncbi:hypothetical protein cyc_06774 [Cyclospora cayetanensis]|uniref:Fas-associated factor 1/2-like UAS domain-containing protein n=1 Tax=Cyclospora cayetanensis TaxID=88456 RepID=A0A1D3CUG7_9EIME|nr:hypothetical protein cyc_06774 [Cyclospora cayetanensis]